MGTRLAATIYSSSAPFPGRAPACAWARPPTASTPRLWLFCGRCGQLNWEPHAQWPRPVPAIWNLRPRAAGRGRGRGAPTPTRPTAQQRPQSRGSAPRGQAHVRARGAPGAAEAEPGRPSIPLPPLARAPRTFSGEQTRGPREPRGGKKPRGPHPEWEGAPVGGGAGCRCGGNAGPVRGDGCRCGWECGPGAG